MSDQTPAEQIAAQEAVRKAYPCAGLCGGRGRYENSEGYATRCPTCHGTGYDTQALAADWLKQRAVVEAAKEVDRAWFYPGGQTRSRDESWEETHQALRNAITTYQGEG